VNILAPRKRLDQGTVTGEMGQDAQFDLRIVGREQEMPGRADESTANAPPLFTARRDILQVRLGRAQAAGRGQRLVE